MSSSSSWRAPGSHSRNGRYNDDRMELPRWRTSSPSASMIPPPIVQSVHGSSPRQSAKSIVLEQPSAHLDREEELQADLQYLLDAQAEGLLKGLGKAIHEDGESNGSITPTASRVRSSTTMRATIPVRRKPGLRSARKGIYNSIIALSVMREEDLQAADGEVLEKEEALAHLDEWESKRHGLIEAADSVKGNEENVRSQRLREEADVLQQEINSMELRLSGMRARHRDLVKQASAAENSMQAKLASYNSSISMLEADVRRFLSMEPERVPRLRTDRISTSMWQVPAKLRTLEMAKTELSQERDDVRRRRKGIEREKKALDEGARVWRRVVAQILEYEKLLRSNVPPIHAHMPESSSAAWEDPDDINTGTAPDNLHLLHESLSKLILSLEGESNHAEEQRWNLLIAAIGAELDALRQGQQILQGLMSDREVQEEPTKDQDEAGRQSREGSGTETRDLDKSFETARRRSPNQTTSDTDEDAAPENLLFSTHTADAD